MKKLIIAGIAFVLLLGGFIVYMEIDKKSLLIVFRPCLRLPINR